MGTTVFPAPVGDLTITASDSAITGVWFPPSRHARPQLVQSRWRSTGPAAELLERACGQLAEYFARRRTTFDLPLAAEGSPFELRVWGLLRTIPYGTTTTYGDVARRLGDPRASRAVGAANGKNPIPIIVPCHRVVGANGDLTGFGGGIERKRWLLEFEGALLL